MIRIEELTSENFNQDILDILSEAFKYKNEMSIKRAKNILRVQKKSGNVSFILYLDDKTIGVATAIFQYKIIHSGSLICIIEDVAIHKNYRGFGYGKNLVDYICEFAKKKGAYKCILYCSTYNVKFYEKCGFKHKSCLMRKDLI